MKKSNINAFGCESCLNNNMDEGISRLLQPCFET
jgi:hypothetical protein